MATTVFEGNWDEMEFSGSRLRVTVLEKKKPQPTRKAQEIRKQFKELQKDMRFTDSSKA